MPTTISGTGGVSAVVDGTIVAADIASGAVTPAKLSQPYTLDTAKASTSGTSIDFTGIPSWAKRITVMFSGVSTNGASNLLVQLGDAGGFETSGYQSVASDRADETQSTAGFILSSGNAASTIIDGLMTIHILDVASNLWAESGVISGRDVRTWQFAGTKSLSGTLDRVRITTIVGSETFDAGTINIAYEG